MGLKCGLSPLIRACLQHILGDACRYCILFIHSPPHTDLPKVKKKKNYVTVGKLSVLQHLTIQKQLKSQLFKLLVPSLTRVHAVCTVYYGLQNTFFEKAYVPNICTLVKLKPQVGLVKSLCRYISRSLE